MERTITKTTDEWDIEREDIAFRFYMLGMIVAFVLCLAGWAAGYYLVGVVR